MLSGQSCLAKFLTSDNQYDVFEVSPGEDQEKGHLRVSCKQLTGTILGEF